jgi:hypothetical protein
MKQFAVSSYFLNWAIRAPILLPDHCDFIPCNFSSYMHQMKANPRVIAAFSRERG